MDTEVGDHINHVWVHYILIDSLGVHMQLHMTTRNTSSACYGLYNFRTITTWQYNIHSLHACMHNFPSLIGANHPDDFSSTSSSVTFTSSANRHCLIIAINYDYLNEDMETFDVVLSGPDNTYITEDTTTVYINNVYRT